VSADERGYDIRLDDKYGSLALIDLPLLVGYGQLSPPAIGPAMRELAKAVRAAAPASS
jgi:hypothetical protein